MAAQAAKRLRWYAEGGLESFAHRKNGKPLPEEEQPDPLWHGAMRDAILADALAASAKASRATGRSERATKRRSIA